MKHLRKTRFLPDLKPVACGSDVKVIGPYFARDNWRRARRGKIQPGFCITPRCMALRDAKDAYASDVWFMIARMSVSFFIRFLQDNIINLSLRNTFRCTDAFNYTNRKSRHSSLSCRRSYPILLWCTQSQVSLSSNTLLSVIKCCVRVGCLHALKRAVLMLNLGDFFCLYLWILGVYSSVG